MNSPEAAQLKQGIKRTFDLAASGYDTPAMRYFPFSADVLAASLQPKRGDKVLDLATGTGMAAIAIAQMLGPAGRVQAIDLSDKMLDKALQNIHKAGLSNIDLHTMDAEQLEFKSQYFDAASCAFGLFFLPDMLKGAKEVLRVLKPGGRFIYTTFAQQAFSPLVDLFREHIIEFGVKFPTDGWRRLVDEQACLDLLQAAGFEQTRINKRQLGYHLAHHLDWWEILYNSGFRGMLEQLDPQQLGEFRQRHLAEIDKLKTDKGIWLDVEVIFVFGKRPT